MTVQINKVPTRRGTPGRKKAIHVVLPDKNSILPFDGMLGTHPESGNAPRGCVWLTAEEALEHLKHVVLLVRMLADQREREGAKTTPLASGQPALQVSTIKPNDHADQAVQIKLATDMQSDFSVWLSPIDAIRHADDVFRSVAALKVNAAN